MIPLVKVLLAALGGAAVWETGVQIKEHKERHNWFNWSREYCNSVGKPLLTVGLQRGTYNPPDGDIVVDVDPEVLNIPTGVLSSVTAMPFPDKSFGVAYNSHVLEHLQSPEDIEAARAGLEAARRALDGTYDLVILDELNVAIDFELVGVDDVLHLLRSRAPWVDVVVTGRYAPAQMIELADMVSEVREIKHHFKKGAGARKGIEY